MKKYIKSDIIYPYVFLSLRDLGPTKEFTATEGCILSKEIILKIKEAEAAQRVRRAETDGKKLCEKAEADAAKVNREKLSITAERADDLLGRAKEDAQKEAEELRESAEFNLREAVRLIVAGVYEQCQ